MCAYVEVSKNNGILEVILNKPKVNAIDHKMSQEIANAFSELKNDQNLKVGIISAKGNKIQSHKNSKN